jgi:deferrochelatase/peroxidase EfeB
MGARPVSTPGKSPRRWKLKAPLDQEVQGFVVSGFARLPSAEALFLRFDWPENGPGMACSQGKGAWLKELGKIAAISDADGADPRAAALAFTWTGLQKIGLPAPALATFAQPFREGMYQEDRLRRLGDRIDETWERTVVDGGPRWSANIPVRRSDNSPDLSGEREPDERQVVTDLTVHALLVLYEENPTAAREWADRVEAALAPFDVRIAHKLLLDLRLDERGIGREHFGFADGLSQPVPYTEKSGDPDVPDQVVWADGTAVARDDWHGVPLGEILLGHTNGHHEKAPGPFVPDELVADQAGLVTDGAPVGYRNLGLNGSYLVVRELHQRVAAFWQNLEDEAARIRAHDPDAGHVTADWLAERVIGRNVDGDLLCPGGVLARDQLGQPGNAFGFRVKDPDGVGCPLGSHVRRANPRDSLAKDFASGQTLLDAANNHRILRRGRKFGSTLTARNIDDGEERGLLFMCLTTDIARQFEFVQQTWLLNENFHTLFDETDPLMGPEGRFTIREQPLRRVVQVKTFIQCAGGDYFFLPSVPALRYLAAL